MGLFDIFRKKPKPRPTEGGEPTGVGYTGGGGGTMETAVVVHASSSMSGIPAVYAYVSAMHGERGRDWELELQALMHADGRHFDVLKIKLANGKQETYHFDISEFFGKF